MWRVFPYFQFWNRYKERVVHLKVAMWGHFWKHLSMAIQIYYLNERNSAGYQKVRFGAMGWVSSYFQIYHILKILRCKRVKSTSYVVTYVSWLVGETYRIDLLQTKYLSWLLNTLPNFFHLDMTWLEYMYCWSIAFCKQRFTNNDGICKRNTIRILNI